MGNIKKEELHDIKGGMFIMKLPKIGIVISFGITLLTGIVNGFQNPLPCNSKK